MTQTRLRRAGRAAGLGGLLFAALLFGAAGAAQAAPQAVPGHGNGQGQAQGPAASHGNGQGQGPGTSHGNGAAASAAAHAQDHAQNANERALNGAAVVWTTRPLTATLAAGASLDTTATFTVTRAVTDVRVSLLPNGAGALTVTPNHFATLTPGQTYTVRLHLQVPQVARRGAYQAQVRLLAGRHPLGPPLAVHIKVQRPTR